MCFLTLFGKFPANDTFVYPNSIENMRERLKTDIGYLILERKVLPQWMQDKQTDDTIIGWTLAAPSILCFRKAEKTHIDLNSVLLVMHMMLNLLVLKLIDLYLIITQVETLTRLATNLQ